jgi:cytoskeletal protein CcmA (bactofilin family)
MKIKNSLTELTINSIIGENTYLKGLFNIKGPLRIDGNFSGKINSTNKVIIGKGGRAECMIVAKVVIVGGTVKGDIYAEDKVLVLKTGEVIGNIYGSSVTMEDGVIFNGKCTIISKSNIKDVIEQKAKEEYIFK